MNFKSYNCVIMWNYVIQFPYLPRTSLPRPRVVLSQYASVSRIVLRILSCNRRFSWVIRSDRYLYPGLSFQWHSRKWRGGGVHNTAHAEWGDTGGGWGGWQGRFVFSSSAIVNIHRNFPHYTCANLFLLLS